jgi:hypothetical protein
VSNKKSLNRIASALEAAQRTPLQRDTAAEERIKQPRAPIMYRVRVALQVSDKSSAFALRAVSSFPIMGFVGPNGGGKTLAAVKLALAALRAGRRVLSTVPLLDPATGEPHPLYVPFTDWDQLLEWEDGDVLADEVITIAGSREHASLDVRAQALLVQLRKRNVRFWWTAPSFARCDKIIREVTQAVTECRGFYADRAAAQVRRGVIQSWAPKRLFAFRTYDTVEFEEWTAGKRERAVPLVAEWFKGPGSEVFKAYDTLGAVNVIAGVGDGGLCDTCGGTVSNKPRGCRCNEPRRPARARSTDVDHQLVGEPQRLSLAGR